jgi:hypothetical protein
MNDIAPRRFPDDEEWEGLWEGFLENYQAFKDGKMLPEDEDTYKLLSSPRPSQYCAFAELFDFFEHGEQVVTDNPDSLYTYDLIDTENITAHAMLDFLHNLCAPAYEAKGKTIVFSSGSFWEPNLRTREKMISFIEELYGKGARITIFARADEAEAGVADIPEPIRKESRFGLKKRIPIHFIKAGKDFVYMDFPHTESSLFRLVMFLDLNKLEPQLKKGKTKEDLSNFFDELIQRSTADELLHVS